MTSTDSPTPGPKGVDLKALLAARGLKLTDLAARLGKHKGNISHWAKTRVPAERVLDVSEATGIPPHEIRPDVFPAVAAQ